MGKFIRGSKGGSRSREPVRAEDTLDSKEFATIQDLLSEGEIEGWATPSKKGITRNNPNYAKACLADILSRSRSVLLIAEITVTISLSFTYPKCPTLNIFPFK